MYPYASIDRGGHGEARLTLFLSANESARMCIDNARVGFLIAKALGFEKIKIQEDFESEAQTAAPISLEVCPIVDPPTGVWVYMSSDAGVPKLIIWRNREKIGELMPRDTDADVYRCIGILEAMGIASWPLGARVVKVGAEPFSFRDGSYAANKLED